MLCWDVRGEDIHFHVDTNGRQVSPDQWALLPTLQTVDGHLAHTGSLTRLVADDRATVEPGGSLRVPGAEIARLASTTLAALGLPPPASVSIQLSKKGLLSDPEFKAMLRFLDGRSRPILDAERAGPVLSMGGRRFTLRDSLYTLATAVDALNAATGVDRYDPLAAIQECLPPDSVVDGHLKETRILRADAFTLRPHRAHDGTVQFDAVPLRKPIAPDFDDDSGDDGSQLLPEARQDEWARYFRKLPRASRTSSAGGGWFVVASPGLTRALEVVKERQSASPSERAAFARNPRGILRERLGAVIPIDAPGWEEALEDIDQLFADLGAYGDRVREVGLWQPKVLPVLPGGQQSWLPPEMMGLRIGDTVVQLPKDRAPELLQKLTAAQKNGEPSIEFEGEPIPATQEAITAVQALVDAAAAPAAAAGDEPVPPNVVAPAGGKLVALIADNIDEVTYRRRPRAAAGKGHHMPAALQTKLFDFQQRGLYWMQSLWIAGAPGGILADDMGLGKTVQTLAFLAWVGEIHHDRRPILIVGPTGLLRNWRAEHDQHLSGEGLGECIEAHGTGLTALKVGNESRRNELATGLPSLDLLQLRGADWVLTTYENLRDYHHSFAQVSWRVVVFDEAQRIKNPQVLTTEAAKTLNAEFTLAVTGTPVENHLIDLWSIADTAQPGALGSLKEFAKAYQAQGPTDRAALEELRLRVQEMNPPPMMLRRMKVDHVEGLPQIHVHVERVAMPPVQADRYTLAVNAARQIGATGRSGMLDALQQMRAVSLHPLLGQEGSDADFIDASARLTHTISVLDQLQQRGEKALVFVEAIAMQDVLVELLQRRYTLPAPPIVINGELAGHKRKDRVDTFQKRRGFDVMLLSPRAGGVGLTIIEANHVIHLSRWWNPAVEDQATDRVYRIGQKRDVHVHLPLAVHPQYGGGSFDVLLHELLERKRALSRGVLAPAAASDGDMKDLFTASTSVSS